MEKLHYAMLFYLYLLVSITTFGSKHVILKHLHDFSFSYGTFIVSMVIVGGG